ncbi:hypothetical protein PVK06_017472 [Gossypium arboreum]|uniref:Uncharacterized protein n=1 Tax=Gossypium arboreum TaxID=29729 RepID=A0ABR0Q2R2_GOSAR|nr:hypothetical protein PVK06_017472 [Gossypium arboreum]
MSACDSFAATWKGKLFVEEGEGSSIADLALSVVGDTVTSILPSVTGDVMVVAPTIEDVAPADQDQRGGDDLVKQ